MPIPDPSHSNLLVAIHHQFIGLITHTIINLITVFTQPIHHKFSAFQIPIRVDSTVSHYPLHIIPKYPSIDDKPPLPELIRQILQLQALPLLLLCLLPFLSFSRFSFPFHVKTFFQKLGLFINPTYILQ